MTEPAHQPDEKVHRTFEVIGLLAVLVIAIFWYTRNPDYEPLMTIVATTSPLVARLFIRGNKGLALNIGLFLGCLIAGLVTLAWSNHQQVAVDTEQGITLQVTPRDWKMFTVSMSKPDFRERVERFFAQTKTHFGGIQAGLREGTDFYLWAREDGDGPAWKLKSLQLNEDSNWRDVIEDLAKQRKITLVGFSRGPQAALWYLEAQ